jgi:hypothetical protein
MVGPIPCVRSHVSSQSARFVESLATPGPLAESLLLLVLVAPDVHVQGVD